MQRETGRLTESACAVVCKISRIFVNSLDGLAELIEVCSIFGRSTGCLGQVVDKSVWWAFRRNAL